MSSPIEDYLKPTPSIDCESMSITEKAQALTKGQGQITDKAKSLFYFVRDKVKYNPYSPFYLPEHYRASNILSRGEGYCVQKAVLLAALARASGIPTRLRLVDIRNYIVSKKLADMMGTDLFTYHGYDELYIGGKWVKATPAFDLKMCQENRIIPVEFDGETDAIFHSHNQDGKLHIEYVRDHGYYLDVPLDEILNAWTQAYGSERVKQMRETFREATER